MLDYKDRIETKENRAIRLSARLIEARRSYPIVPGSLKSYDVIEGLIDIGSVGTYRLSTMSPHEATRRQKRAVTAVRTLIGGIIIGGVPHKKAFGFFDINDLNLLFGIHHELQGADGFPDSGFMDSAVEGHDDE